MKKTNNITACLCAVNASYTHTSLALLRFKSVCGEKAYYREYSINDTVERVCGELYALKCALYAFGCYIWNLEFVKQLASRLKAVQPNCKILFGGPEITYDTEVFMQQHPYVDYCLRGEGEESLPKLISGVRIQEIDGLCFRAEDGSVIKSPAIVQNLSVLPKLYDRETLALLENKIIYYETSRGCPYNCSYCLSSTEHNVRFFDEEKVLQELKLFMDSGVSLVKLTDRTFNLGDARTARLLRFILENNRCTCFHFEVSADVLGAETMRLLKSAPKGMFQLEIGVQTTNPQTAAAIDRHANFERLRENVIQLKSAKNMHMHLDLIAGLPYENYDSFAKSFDDVFALEPDMLQLGFLKLLKGTKIRAQAEEFGYVFVQEPPYEVLASRWMSYEEMLRLKTIEYVLELFYNSGNFSAALKYSMDCSRLSAFAYFEKLAAFWQTHMQSGVSYSGKRLYAAFYAFHTECILPDDGLFNALLVSDQLIHNKTAQPDAWAKLPQANKTFYDYAWKVVKNSGYLSEKLLAMKLKDMLQFVRVLRMDYDVLTREKRDSITVFDYTNKNIYSLAVTDDEKIDL